MFCDKGMIESFTIAKKELEIAYYRVINARYNNSFIIDIAMNMFAREVLDCRLMLATKERPEYQLDQNEKRMILFRDTQKKLERIYSMLRLSVAWDRHCIDSAYNVAIKSIEDCEAIDLSPQEIEEN